MKILYVLNSTNIFGGSTKSFIRYFEEISKKYPDFHAIICAPSPLPESITERFCIHTYKVPLAFHIYPPTKSKKDKLLFLPKLIYKIFNNYLSYKKIYTIAYEEKVDIIHTNVGVVNAGYLAARKLNIPHIYHLREYQTSDFGMKIIPSFKSFKQSLKAKNNYNICIAYGIQKHFNLDDNNSKVIYNGVKHESYNPEITTKEKYFLFVGRIEENKGIRDVINVFSTFAKRNEDFRLLVAGDTKNEAYKKALMQEVASMGLENRIFFLGNRKDIDHLMQRATAIIIASSKEAFGLITAEAAFNKCLIIGKNTGGTAEQINNGTKIFSKEAGISYQTDKELLEVLSKVSENVNHQATIDIAYQCALTLYSIESCSNSIYNLYTTILNNQHTQ